MCAVSPWRLIWRLRDPKIKQAGHVMETCFEDLFAMLVKYRIMSTEVYILNLDLFKNV